MEDPCGASADKTADRGQELLAQQSTPPSQPVQGPPAIPGLAGMQFYYANKLRNQTKLN